MPLIHGKSNKAFVHNLKTEMHAGKPQKQSLAIAYSLKRRAQHHKMAEGGETEFNKEEMKEMPVPLKDRADMHEMSKHKMHEKMSKRERAIHAFEGGQITDNYQSPKTSKITHPNMGYHEKDEYDPKEEPERKHNERAIHEDNHDLGQHGAHEEGPEGPTVDAEDIHHEFEHPVENQFEGIEEDMVGKLMKQREKCYAKGGMAHHKKEHHYAHGRMSHHKPHHMAEGGKPEHDHYKLFSGSKEHPKELNYEKDEEGNEINLDYNDPKMREHNNKEYRQFLNEKKIKNAILSQAELHEYAHGGESHMCSGASCTHYSHGGMSHHKKSHHYSEGGKVANEDLPIVDDMPAEYDDLHLRDDLHESYTGVNSGDELNDAREDHDREDMISRIMKSRRKKDRMPVPA